MSKKGLVCALVVCLFSNIFAKTIVDEYKTISLSKLDKWKVVTNSSDSKLAKIKLKSATGISAILTVKNQNVSANKSFAGKLSTAMVKNGFDVLSSNETTFKTAKAQELRLMKYVDKAGGMTIYTQIYVFNHNKRLCNLTITSLSKNIMQKDELKFLINGMDLL